MTIRTEEQPRRTRDPHESFVRSAKRVSSPRQNSDSNLGMDQSEVSRLEQLRAELKARTFRPLAVQQRMIPKANGNGVASEFQPRETEWQIWSL